MPGRSCSTRRDGRLYAFEPRQPPLALSPRRKSLEQVLLRGPGSGLAALLAPELPISHIPSTCLTSSQEKSPYRGRRGVPSWASSPDIPPVDENEPKSRSQ